MEYQVPQFIEVEDKIIGPFTLKQFIYIAGAAGICIVFFSYLPIFFALILALPVAGLGAALSFYKINGKPFIEVLEAGFNYYTKQKLLLWKQADPTQEESAARTAAEAASAANAAALAASRRTPKLTRSKLAELAWSLDVKSMNTNSDSSS
jgi:hypothetical protein